MTNLTTAIHGGCFCGRNRYTFTPASTDMALEGGKFGPPPYVYYDHCSTCRKLQSSLLLGWFRAPEAWFSRSTHPQSPDETEEQIFKHLKSSPKVDRHFCGFCGTQLMYAAESHRKEGWAEVTLGSIDDESLEKLDEMGLKPDRHYYWRSAVSWVKRDLVKGTVKDEVKIWSGDDDEGEAEGDGLGSCPEHLKQ